MAQANELWRNLSAGQKLTAGVITLVSLSVLFGIIFFVQRTEWRSFGAFEPAQAAQIKSELEKNGFKNDKDFRVTDGGRRIEVDARQYDEITLALAEKGLIGEQEKGFSIFENWDLSVTDFEQKLRNIEALKSEMRRMMRCYSQVEDIVISVPFMENESLFGKKDQDQTASAVLTLKPGARLDERQIKAIRGLISGGFPGLKPEKIQLTDQYANELAVDDENASGLNSKQGQIQRETEKGLEGQIRKLIGPVLGDKNFTVTVNVEFDWDNVKINIIDHSVPGFDQYKESEQSQEEILKGQGLRPGGEPGVTANSAPVYQATTGVGPVDYSRSERIVNYLTNKKTEDRIRSPFVKRICAAVAVDGLWKMAKDTEGKIVPDYQPRSADEMKQITALVQAALGNNPQREDLIEVRNFRWDRAKEFEAAESQQAAAEFQKKLMLYGLLTAPLFVVFFLMYAAWRRHVRVKEEELNRQRELERQRALAEAETALQGELSFEEQERQDILRRAKTLARAKPQIVADLLRTWLADESAA